MGLREDSGDEGDEVLVESVVFRATKRLFIRVRVSDEAELSSGDSVEPFSDKAVEKVMSFLIDEA